MKAYFLFLFFSFTLFAWTQPDLVVTSISLDRSTANPGEPVDVDITIKNQGDRNARNFRVTLWMSNDPSCGADIPALNGAANVQFLDAGHSLNLTLTFEALDIWSRIYPVVKVDDPNLVPESNENNNCEASFSRVDIFLPDLTASEAEPVQPRMTRRFAVPFDITIKNEVGTHPRNAGESNTRFYMVPDGEVLDDNHLLDYSVNTPPIKVGNEYRFEAAVLATQ